jgi:anti-sigma factor RsiW
MTEPDLPCNQFVELVTDYLEGALTPDEIERVDEHLDGCTGCAEVLAQWRAIIDRSRALGDRHVDELDHDTRAALEDAFRQARRPA